MNILAVIPARGGSKGIPKKNIAPLCGRPLIAYSIDVARESKLINRVIVTTDDDIIARVAMDCGAEVPFIRPKHLATDQATLNATLAHVQQYLLKNDWVADVVVVLLPTHPFRTPSLVDHLISKSYEGYSPVKTVKSIEVDRIKYFRNKNGALKNIMEGQAFLSSSNNRFYREYGLVSCSIPRVFNREYVYTIQNPMSLLDIDTPHDLKIAESVIEDGLFDFIHSIDPIPEA